MKTAAHLALVLAAGKEQNIPIEETFKRVRLAVNKVTDGRQTPWDSSSLTEDFYRIYLRRDAGQSELVTVGRICVLAVALLAIWLASALVKRGFGKPLIIEASPQKLRFSNVNPTRPAMPPLNRCGDSSV